jgi:hypothetical protein
MQINFLFSPHAYSLHSQGMYVHALFAYAYLRSLLSLYPIHEKSVPAHFKAMQMTANIPVPIDTENLHNTKISGHFHQSSHEVHPVDCLAFCTETS